MLDVSSSNLLSQSKYVKVKKTRPILRKEIDTELKRSYPRNERTWEVAELQAYLLSSTNDDKRNVFHNVCRIGAKEMLEFLMNEAKTLGILHFLVNARDELQHTPLYLLCEKGHTKTSDVKEHHKKYRTDMLKILLPKGSGDGKNRNAADWRMRAKQIGYSPLHWLAYWDDLQAFQYFVSIIPPKELSKILCLSVFGLTPLDIAGKNKSDSVAQWLITYLTDKFDIIKKLFQSLNIKAGNNKVWIGGDDPESF